MLDLWLGLACISHGMETQYQAQLLFYCNAAR